MLVPPVSTNDFLNEIRETYLGNFPDSISAFKNQFSLFL